MEPLVEKTQRRRVRKFFRLSTTPTLANFYYIQVARYGKNKSNPSADVLNRMAAALYTDIDYIMKAPRMKPWPPS
jgi:transcriptional regulator with XRE-family HTH domain